MRRIRVSDKTLRDARQWVKITRNAVARTWTFARGRAGELKAQDVQSYDFASIRTWADAKEHARGVMAAYS